MNSRKSDYRMGVAQSHLANSAFSGIVQQVKPSILMHDR